MDLLCYHKEDGCLNHTDFAVRLCPLQTAMNGWTSQPLLYQPPSKPHHTSPCEVLTVHTESATSNDFKRVLRTVTVQTRYDPSQHNGWLMSHVIIYVSWINLLSFHIDMSWSKRTKTLRLLAFQMQNVTVSILSFTLEPGWFISRSMLSDDVSYVPLQHLQ